VIGTENASCIVITALDRIGSSRELALSRSACPGRLFIWALEAGLKQSSHGIPTGAV